MRRETILFFILFVKILFAQEKLYEDHEIFLLSINEHETYADFLTYKMEAVSTVFSKNFCITDSFQYCENTIPIPWQTNKFGFDHVITPIYNLTFGYGLYKVSISYLNDTTLFQFYLDWRDCDYSDFYNGKNDVWIKLMQTSNICSNKL